MCPTHGKLSDVTGKPPVGDISVVTLTRTDTTKGRKGMRRMYWERAVPLTRSLSRERCLRLASFYVSLACLLLLLLRLPSCSVPDLTRDPAWPVFRAGPQPRDESERRCQKECQRHNLCTFPFWLAFLSWFFTFHFQKLEGAMVSTPQKQSKNTLVTWAYKKMTWVYKNMTPGLLPLLHARTLFKRKQQRAKQVQTRQRAQGRHKWDYTPYK